MRQRHALYLSQAMTQRLQVMAETHRVAKSEILERALKRYLADESGGQPADLLVLQQESNSRSLRRLERDLAIAAELMATFVRYFLTITPPLPESEHAAARALGQLRFDQVIEDIARRLRTDRSLIARVAAIPSETAQGKKSDIGMSDSFAYAQRQASQATDDGRRWALEREGRPAEDRALTKATRIGDFESRSSASGPAMARSTRSAGSPPSGAWPILRSSRISWCGRLRGSIRTGSKCRVVSGGAE
jgi:hypothetical protein